jgi:hypothetical protein
MRFRATMIVEYDVNPEYYESADPAAMAAVDRTNFEQDPTWMASMAEPKITVELVRDHDS